MRVDGLAELKRTMRNMAHIEDDVSLIMRGNCYGSGDGGGAAEIAAKRARRVMNKGYWTGNLARSITAEMNGKLSFVLISGAYYSGYLEYGTRYMTAEPFMRPTVKEIKNQLKEDFSMLLKG